MLIATAGHVDHGKTALIQTLTGTDTDRLPEEKQRGLTIDLGFAYSQDGSLGFVDVPGHERFIRNMLAGVPAIDLVLLVVAADDGVMPQTREHLAIVSLLGVTKAVVAITKTDLVDTPRIAAVSTEVTALLNTTGITDAAIFPVAALQNIGIKELSEHLNLIARHHTRRSDQGLFRLAIDRCFTVAGAGLIATGAVFSGSVNIGDYVQLLPDKRRARVRGIHSQGLTAKSSQAGDRCAVNITGPGIELRNVQRGDWLVSPEQGLLTDRVDVQLRLVESEKTALKHWTPVHIHAGSGSATGRVALLQDKLLQPGQQTLAQLVLDQPTLLVFADRFVIRDQSAQRTLGGGYIIDPFGVKRGRSKPERIALLQALDTDSAQQALLALLQQAPLGVKLNDFANSRNLCRDEMAVLADSVSLVEIDSVALSTARWQNLCEHILNALQHWHTEYPDRVGPNARQLRQASSSSEVQRIFTAALQQLIRRGDIVREGVWLRLPEHSPQLADTEQVLLNQITQYIQAEQLKPPALKDLAELLNIERDTLGKQLQSIAQRGLLVRISASRYFHPAAVNRLAAYCQQLCQQHDDGMFDVRSFRDIAGIGRNASIEILEYFDSVGFTQRLGERRRLHPNY